MRHEAEAILGLKIPVLDHGFVRLVDYMGSDASINHYAHLLFEDEEEIEMKQRIGMCFRKLKMSPFEQASLVFQIRLPIYIMGQLVRHRTAKLNSFSARYAKVEDRFHEPCPDELRMQGGLNKQVGSGLLDPSVSENCSKSIQETIQIGYQTYLSLTENGLCREQARMVLPQSMYTTIFWKMDLRNLFHFLKLRLHKGAQREMQLYAKKIGEVVSGMFPVCWECFNQIFLTKISLSRLELLLLERLNVEW